MIIGMALSQLSGRGNIGMNLGPLQSWVVKHDWEYHDDSRSAFRTTSTKMVMRLKKIKGVQTDRGWNPWVGLVFFM